MTRFRFMGVQEDPEFDTIEARGDIRIYDGTKRTKRDEFSCPCCGVGTDSSYCVACDAFECGEQDVGTDKCLVPKNVTVTRAEHAAHYSRGGGHDLLTVEVVVPPGQPTPHNKRGEPEVRPEGLPSGFRYHSGTAGPTGQRWRFIKTAPLSPGKCARCT